MDFDQTVHYAFSVNVKTTNNRPLDALTDDFERCTDTFSTFRGILSCSVGRYIDHRRKCDGDGAAAWFASTDHGVMT